MKKLLALTLALAMCIATFSACSSAENTDEQISSLSEEEGKELLKENNSISKLIFTTVNQAIADQVVECVVPAEGIYRFSFDQSMTVEKPEFKAETGNYMSVEDSEELLKYVIVAALTDSDTEIGEISIVINQSGEYSEIEKVNFSDSSTSMYTGQYPDPPTKAPTYTIDNVPTE